MLKLLEFSVKPLDKIRIYLDKNLFKSINWIKQVSQRSRSKNMLMDSGFWQDAHFGKFSPDSKSCVWVLSVLSYLTPFVIDLISVIIKIE